MLAHTRWASVGLIGQPNAHPLNSDEEARRRRQPYVVAALNGDVDNHADLKAAEGLRIPVEITTDAKVIPMMVSRRLSEGMEAGEAFRRVVASFEGSVAIAAGIAEDPNTVLLAQRGSGQGLYVGLAEDAYVVASEPYGLVEETAEYVRLDGETPSDPDNPNASRGQVVMLDGRLALARWPASPGSPTTARCCRSPPTTCRPRRSPRATSTAAPSLTSCLKEMDEAPGVVAQDPAGPHRRARRDAGCRRSVPRRFRLSSSTGSGSGAIERVIVIGQGTAAVAGQSLALTLTDLTDGRRPSASRRRRRRSCRASACGRDMSDTLIVAISQSGTHDRHQPHRRRRALAGCVGDRHRQPSTQRPH